LKKRILIIDDEERIREIYKRYFNAVGASVFEIIETGNAREATEYIIREPVDIIILDIEMPGVDGRVMFEIIKEYNPDLKVIVASVYPIDQQKRLIPFALDYFDKSQGIMKLLAKVSHVLVET
jgi:DNA-binding NtrC family response regulator